VSREGSEAFRRTLGLDYTFIGRWVGLHERVCECDPPPDPAKDEVWWTGVCAHCSKRVVEMFDAHQIAELLGHGEAKAAITMKYATKEGYAEVDRSQDRRRWRPTQKALEAFPPDRPHVLPEHEAVEMEHGTFKPLSGQEIREQTDAQLEAGQRRRELGRG
jgi:hypothetical protein